MSRVETIKRRLPGALWTLAWMFPLITPVIEIVDGHVPHPVMAGIGLGAFALVYLIVAIDAFDEGREPQPRVDIPRVLICAALGVTLLWTYGTHDQWANIVIYIAVAGAIVFPTRWAITWVLGTCAMFLIYSTIGPGHRPGSLSEWGALSFAVLLASGLVFAMRRMISYIGQLRATRAKLAQIAVSEERLRFSRDLHDLLGHTLSLIVVKAEVVRRLAEHDPAAAAREAAEIETIGRQALAEVRDAVSGYREPDFATAAGTIRSALMDAGMSVRMIQPTEPLPAPANTLFGWAIREAGTNAIRHSRARTCTIEVSMADEQATLVVSDDGLGSRGDQHTGTGLLGLRERFALAGGTVETSSPPGRGFRLIATVPTASREICEAGI